MLSPMAKGEQMSEVENIVRFIEMLKMLGGEEVAAIKVNVDAAVDVMAELMNVPQKIMNDPEQAQKVATAFAKRGAAEAGGDPAVAEQAMQEMAPE